MDPLIMTLLIAGGIFLVSYMMGRSHGQAKQERVIAATIDHLISDGYLEARKNDDGEIVLITINAIRKEIYANR